MSTQNKRTLARTTLSSRRDLLRALGLAGGAALLAPFAPRGGATAYAAVAMTAGLMLEVDGSYSPVDAAEGGNAFAEVGSEPPQDAVLRKHLVAVRYEDLVVQVVLGAASAQLMSWVGAALQNGAAPKSGAIIYADYSGKEMRRLEFFNAVITEVALPACDAGVAKDRGRLTLRIVPQGTRLVGASGKTVGGGMSKTQTINTSLFRMSVAGLESACSTIRSVSAPSAKRPLVRAGGTEKLGKVSSGQLDCAPLSIVLPERDAGPFYSWFDDFALKGNANAERPGRLEFLASTVGSVLATVDFGNLGITRFAPLPLSADAARGSVGASSGLAMVQVDMFCETMSLTVT
jgi:hypothetical protein